MKFQKGQKVICIADKKDWDSVVNDFDTNLMIAINSHQLPQEGETYVINCPMELHYKGKCYISLEGFDRNTFAESGFKEFDVFSKGELISEKIGKLIDFAPEQL